MNQLFADRRVRLLIIAVLAVVLVLGLLNIVSTALSLLVPLALLTVGAFAFYKIVLQGRDQPEAMQDEVAEASGHAGEALHSDGVSDAGAAAIEAEEARQRLSAVERARNDYIDKSSPAEEILDQIKSRRQRLAGDDDA